jgi:zinc protease
MSSRLFRILRDERGLAYAVGSLCPTRRHTGRVVAYIGTAPANADAAEAGLGCEIERLATERVPEEELRLARSHLEGSFVLDLRTNARQSFALAFYESMGVGYGYVAEYPARIAAVTADDVARAASRYLREPSVVVVGPD